MKNYGNLIVCLIPLFLGILYCSQDQFSQQNFGKIDSIEYWSAGQAVSKGLNPYDPIEIKAIQKAEQEPLMMWNPPWLLVLLSPIQNSNFDIFAKHWFLINLAFLSLTVLCLCQLFSTRATIVLMALLGFLPVSDSIAFGQLGIFMLFSLSLVYLAISSKHFLLAGLCLSLLTVKPHLFITLFAVLLIWSWRAKELRMLLGFALGLFLLIVSTLFLSENLVFNWFSSMLYPPPGVTRPLNWHTASIASNLVSLVSKITGEIALYPLLVFCFLGNCAVLYWSRNFYAKVTWSNTFPLLVCLSVICAPFAWIFDQAVCGLLQVFLVVKGLKIEKQNYKILIFLLIAATNLIALLILILSTPSHSTFWWIPPALSLIYGLYCLQDKLRQG